ncbi:MAG TPA: hypothetical protein VG722_06495 [Tepidisphaeraceae bacterium]|nr:hypothetical protein [Tepidisphaeraceae bacterium]
MLAVAGSAASAAVTAGRGTLVAGANANVTSTPHPDVTETDDSLTVPPVVRSYSASAEDSSSTSGKSSDISIDNSAQIDNGGSSGSADLTATWVASDILGSSDDRSGSFSITATFFYSFIVDNPSTLIIDSDLSAVSTGYSVNAITNKDFMDLNNVIAYDNNSSFTELTLNGMTHAEIPLSAGFHNFKIEDEPNVGYSPWPNLTETLTNQVTFEIVEVPEPSRVLFLAASGLILCPIRSRRMAARPALFHLRVR